MLIVNCYRKWPNRRLQYKWPELVSLKFKQLTWLVETKPSSIKYGECENAHHQRELIDLFIAFGIVGQTQSELGDSIYAG
jgi:hypothetical protein